MAEVELPLSFSLIAEEAALNRYITTGEENLFYTSSELPKSPRKIGLMVFFSRSDYPNLANDILALSKKPSTLRIFELEADGKHRIVSSYDDIQDPESVYFSIAGGPAEGYKARLIPEENDFAFATTRYAPGNDFNLQTHSYVLHEVKDINPVKATIRLAKTFS